MLFVYLNTELADIHFMFGGANGNAREAQRLYVDTYPNRQTPALKIAWYRFICETISWFRETKVGVYPWDSRGNLGKVGQNPET